ncbi:MAG: flagellar basal body L-ring protein FlgH [Rhodocyclaceae bacterium]
MTLCNVVTALIRLSAIGLLSASLAHAESLYSPDEFRALASDGKAYRVGDVLTVQIIENASATSNADTSTKRDNQINANLRLSNNPSIAGGINIGGDFTGGGTTQRSGRLLAQITVTVREIVDNGLLKIAGEQLLTINGEAQRIGIEGLVRSRDVSDGNVVLSTRVSDAHITYEGDGPLSERQRPSWWRQFLDLIGF